jgi:NAD+ synthase
MKIKIAMASLNPTVGDIQKNSEAIYNAYIEAAKAGADIVVTPEMSLTGYPLEDLTQRSSFLKAVEAEMTHLKIRIYQAGYHKTAIVFGHPMDTGKSDGNRRLVYNSATFYNPNDPSNSIINKTELPNYGVFDEKRNYLEETNTKVIRWNGLRIGLMICEDGWFDRVSSSFGEKKIDLLLWVNGSPFSQGKNIIRRQHAQARFREARAPLVYVNLVGGQDELVFDGDCFAYDGVNFVESELFKPTITMVEMDLDNVREENPIPDVAPTMIGEVYRAKVCAVKDYLHKTGFKSVVLGMSGGIDSAIVASICTDALGAENVHLVRLPSRFSSDGSLVDAAEARDLLGCPMRTIAIEKIVDALRLAYFDPQVDAGDEPRHESLKGVADENIQARARGNILMAIANQEGHMLVTTGNKSEVSVTYFTLYGDSCGGYNILKDTYKTDVSVAAGRNATSAEDVDKLVSTFGEGLVQWRNRLTAEEVTAYGFKGPAGRTVPLSIEAKAESAELAEGQRDSDSLPPYPVLDGIIRCLVDYQMGVEETINLNRKYVKFRQLLEKTRTSVDQNPDETIDAGFNRADVERVNRLIITGEHKRRQTAPGPKVGDMLYNRDRRMPIVNAFRG